MEIHREGRPVHAPAKRVLECASYFPPQRNQFDLIYHRVRLVKPNTAPLISTIHVTLPLVSPNDSYA
uniref:Uncharacterized protein n=1 Tax=Oryza nivara TaxID=4536 RepID=A0A0E0J1D7_ORYNI